MQGNKVTGVLAIRQPFPSIARTVHENHSRYIDTYLRPYPGYYFTGDSASRDEDGYIWIGGRVDDVLNVSGHRLSTAEIESALVLHPACSEAAAIGIHDDISGEAIVCFCTLKSHHADHTSISKSLKLQVRNVIGPFAQPKLIVVVDDLPKTRSGKIMRRILRKIASGEATEGDTSVLGDLSTLADPDIVSALLKEFQKRC